MSITDRREREKQMRRESIIDAAEKLFFAKGIAPTTMDEIAEAAELSKGTIYIYFKSKEEIFLAIMSRSINVLKSLFIKAFDSTSAGLEKVKAMGQAIFTFHKQYPHYFQTMIHHRDNFPIEIDCCDPAVEILIRDGESLSRLSIEAIQAGIDDGTIRPEVDPKKAALALYSMVLGLIHLISIEESFLLKKFGVSGSDLIAHSFDLIEHSMARQH
jgi:TetR/AcrR family transcriptional regulator